VKLRHRFQARQSSCMPELATTPLSDQDALRHEALADVSRLLVAEAGVAEAGLVGTTSAVGAYAEAGHGRISTKSHECHYISQYSMIRDEMLCQVMRQPHFGGGKGWACPPAEERAGARRTVGLKCYLLKVAKEVGAEVSVGLSICHHAQTLSLLEVGH
jgi:hypothetical protein